jgi:hypothetical protein
VVELLSGLKWGTKNETKNAEQLKARNCFRADENFTPAEFGGRRQFYRVRVNIILVSHLNDGVAVKHKRPC